jgi:uncharacterized protein (DUF3084 family)
MDWEASWVDIGIATIIAALIANLLNDFFGWKKVKNRIGNNKSSSLEEQHEDIKDTIVERTSNIYAKVEKINDITVKNEFLYGNLNSNQKEIKENINNFIRDWEKTISENKELKAQVEIFKSEKLELKIDNEKIKESLNKVILNNEKLMEGNTNFKAENKTIGEQLNKIASENGKIISENTNLREENKEIKLENKTIRAELNKLQLSMDKANSKIEDLTLKNTNLIDKNKELNQKLLLSEQLLNLHKDKDSNNKSKERQQEKEDDLEL